MGSADLPAWTVEDAPRRTHKFERCCCVNTLVGSFAIGVVSLSLCFFALVTMVYGMAQTNPLIFQKGVRSEKYWGEYAFFSLVLFLKIFAIMLFLVGLIKRQPTYLLPFFWLLVFSLISMIAGSISMAFVSRELGYYYDHIMVSCRQRMINVKITLAQFRILFAVVTFACITIKSLMVCCIWSCYKSLKCLPDPVVPYQDETWQNLPSYDDSVKLVPPDSPPPYRTV